jgi:hypothetical protein
MTALDLEALKFRSEYLVERHRSGQPLSWHLAMAASLIHLNETGQMVCNKSQLRQDDAANGESIRRSSPS